MHVTLTVGCESGNVYLHISLKSDQIAVMDIKKIGLLPLNGDRSATTRAVAIQSIVRRRVWIASSFFLAMTRLA